MAWYPNATKFEIRPGANDPAIKAIGAILHVTAGTAGGKAIGEYFRDRSGGIESHFNIEKDGTIWQYRDTGYEADANYKANSFLEDGVRKGYISIETVGTEYGKWTDAQLVSIKKLLRWLSDTHDFPLSVCEDPKDPGVGYHTLFGAPGAWTPVAKSCPGPERKKQFRNDIVPWMESREEEPEPKPAVLPKTPLCKVRRPSRKVSWTSKVRYGKRHSKVRKLQRWLLQAGYGPIPGSVTNYYGKNTGAAVARFHNANPHLKTRGVDYDPYIGEKGWSHLQYEARQARRKK